LPDTEQVELWPGDPPGEPTWDREGEIPAMQKNARGSYSFVHEPVLDVYHAKGKNRTGAAVVICPGGGYGRLAYDHEGHQVARWLNEHGITGVILRYRMFPYRHPVPMRDVQRAMQHVRHHAKDWGLQRDKIGVLGFSAGGHLASTATVHHVRSPLYGKNKLNAVSSRPDFAILVYPVISMREGVTHGGSRRNLLGPEPDEALVALMSNDEQVTHNTPPTLLVHSRDDKAVPIENSTRFALGLLNHDIRGRTVYFDTGGHGYGLGRGGGHETDAWPAACIDWLKQIGVIPDDAGEGGASGR